MRMTARPNVVFPQPLSPINPTVSPGSTEKLTSFTARRTAPCRTMPWMAHFEMNCQVSNLEQTHSDSFVRVSWLKDCHKGHRTQWPSATSTSAGTSVVQLSHRIAINDC
jgi:hypothetical protein